MINIQLGSEIGTSEIFKKNIYFSNGNFHFICKLLPFLDFLLFDMALAQRSFDWMCNLKMLSVLIEIRSVVHLKAEIRYFLLS